MTEFRVPTTAEEAAERYCRTLANGSNEELWNLASRDDKKAWPKPTYIAEAMALDIVTQGTHRLRCEVKAVEADGSIAHASIGFVGPSEDEAIFASMNMVFSGFSLAPGTYTGGAQERR